MKLRQKNLLLKQRMATIKNQIEKSTTANGVDITCDQLRSDMVNIMDDFNDDIIKSHPNGSFHRFFGSSIIIRLQKRTGDKLDGILQ